MTPKRATWAPDVQLAGRSIGSCYSCGAELAAFAGDSVAILPMRGAQRSMTLVSRHSIHPGTGLPRFGPPRRNGHRDSRHDRVERAWASIGPVTFYANCPKCDRGQIVEFPAVASADRRAIG